MLCYYVKQQCHSSSNSRHYNEKHTQQTLDSEELTVAMDDSSSCSQVDVNFRSVSVYHDPLYEQHLRAGNAVLGGGGVLAYGARSV